MRGLLCARMLHGITRLLGSSMSSRLYSLHYRLIPRSRREPADVDEGDAAGGRGVDTGGWDHTTPGVAQKNPS